MTYRKSVAVSALLAPPAAAGLLLAGLSGAARANDLYSIRLEALNNAIRPDGRSDTILSAYVYDAQGRVAPNGTRIVFTTTLGRLDSPVAVTENGVARVTLYAANQPGEAVVTANLEGARQAVQARITVRFTTDAERADTGTNWVRLDGSYVGYVADEGKRIIQASGKNGRATLTFRSLSVSADTLQYRVAENRLLAVGNVVVEAAGVRRPYAVLRFDFLSGEGVAEKGAGEEQVPVQLAGANLDESPWPAGKNRYGGDFWALEDLSDARITVVARSIYLERDLRLQFRRATFYVDGQKTVSLPFHEMGVNQETLFDQQLVGFNAQGLVVDLPLYYDVRPQAVGTLHIRNGASGNGSVFGGRQGLTLDAVQTYNGPNNASGAFEIIGMSRPDWGMRLRHGQRLGRDTTANALVDFPNHRSLFLNTQMRRGFKTFALNTSLSASRSPGGRDPFSGVVFGAGGDVRGQVFVDTAPRRFLNEKTVTYALTAGFGRQSFYGGSGGGNSGWSGGYGRGALNSQTVAGRLNSSSYTVGRQTTLQQSLGLGHTWIQGGGGGGGGVTGIGTSGLAMDATTQINRQIPRLGGIDFSYQFRKTPGVPELNADFANPEHTVNLNVALSPGKPWTLYAGMSRALDKPQANLNAAFGFQLGGPWAGRVRFNRSQFPSFSYQETEYALIRRIAKRDVTLYYSTLSKRIQVEISGSPF